MSPKNRNLSLLFIILEDTRQILIMTQHPENIIAFISAFSVVSFGFVFYHVITNGQAYKLWEEISDNNIKPVLMRRLLGILFFGVVPLFVIAFFIPSGTAQYGFSLPGIKTLIWTLIVSCAIIPMNYFNAGSPDNLAQYPQIRNKYWPSSLLILSAISWIAYLLAYEFLLRGFLLFSSIPVLGIWPSIILNAAVYSLIHIPKGSKETLGAIPFGIFISYLAVETGSFWVAFFAHVILALSNEWFSLRAQPEMHFKS